MGALTYALLAAAVVVVVASVRYFFIYLADRDELDRRERAELYQRIQAPEVAVAMHATEDAELPEAVHPESDTDFWEARGVEVEA